MFSTPEKALPLQKTHVSLEFWLRRRVALTRNIQKSLNRRPRTSAGTMFMASGFCHTPRIFRTFGQCSVACVNEFANGESAPVCFSTFLTIAVSLLPSLQNGSPAMHKGGEEGGAQSPCSNWPLQSFCQVFCSHCARKLGFLTALQPRSLTPTSR